MNKLASCMVAVAVLLLVHTGRAEQEHGDPPLRLALELVDGSRIIGAFKAESLPLQTPYAKVDIPLNQIATIRIGNDRETASIELQNGDRLGGTLDVGRIELDAVFGTIPISMEHVAEIQVFSPGSLGPELREAMVLFLSFDRDNAQTIADDSASGNHGTIVHGRHVQHGKVGRAFEFKGTSKIVIPDSESLRVQRHTLSAWVNISDATNEQLRVILSKEKFGAAGGYYLGYDRTKVNYKLMEGGRSAQGYHNTYKTMNLLPGQWHHLAGTFDGSTRTLYVNGEEAETTTHPMVLFHDSTPLEIGSNWNGLIDEVMVFNRCLTKEDIRKLYLSGGRMAVQGAEGPRTNVP